jgi:hypothetical protein
MVYFTILKKNKARGNNKKHRQNSQTIIQANSGENFSLNYNIIFTNNIGTNSNWSAFGYSFGDGILYLYK